MNIFCSISYRIMFKWIIWHLLNHFPYVVYLYRTYDWFIFGGIWILSNIGIVQFPNNLPKNLIKAYLYTYIELFRRKKMYIYILLIIFLHGQEFRFKLNRIASQLKPNSIWKLNHYIEFKLKTNYLISKRFKSLVLISS